MAMRMGWLAGVALAALGAGGGPAAADTYVVDSTADVVDAMPGNGTCATADGRCTLRAAVQEANAHAGPDAITLPAGLYLLTNGGTGEDAAATGDLDVTDALEVNGAGQDTTIIEGLFLDRLFQAGAAFTLRDVTLRTGSATTGGALYLNTPGAKTIERVRCIGNRGDDGGAIAQLNGDLTVTDSTFERNFATASGGAILLMGTGQLAITGSTFTGNAASSGPGGAVYDASTGAMTVAGATFAANWADLGGAMMVGAASSLAVSDTTIDGNYATTGGGLFAPVGNPVSFSGVTLTRNVANAYGGAYLGATTASITAGEVSDNVGFTAFGGLYLSTGGAIGVDGTVFRRNAGGGGPGAALFASSGAGMIALLDIEATENAGGSGGAVFASTGDAVEVARARITGNGSGVQAGGGLYLSAAGHVSVIDSLLSDNVAGAPGGGLFVTADTVSLDGTTLATNWAAGLAGLGGGAFLSIGTLGTLANVTVSGNVADAMGGGVYVSGNATMQHLTFADNDAPDGSALWTSGGTTTLARSIVAGAAASHCAPAPPTSGGNNLDSTGTCGLAGAGDQVADPELAPLAHNGGPTPTHLPAPTSPALDAAGATCPATDQRGQERPTDADGDGTVACDVGAVEFLDLCPADPAKVEPGVCGCGVADTDASFANGTADCLINGELKARVARARTIVAGLAGDADPLEAELSAIGESLRGYVSQYAAQIQLADPSAKLPKLAKKARKGIKKVVKAKAGARLDKARTKATAALDRLDAAVAPQA